MKPTDQMNIFISDGDDGFCVINIEAIASV